MWVQFADLSLLEAAEKALRKARNTKEADEIKTKIDKLRYDYEGDGNAYRQQFVDAAKKTKQSFGETEIDDDAIVSGSDDPGEYVLAWVWVTNEEAGYEAEGVEEDEEDEQEREEQKA